MKTKLILMLLMCSLSAFATLPYFNDGQIKLKGDDPRDASTGEDPGETSRSMPMIPVSCVLEAGVIYIDFLTALGDLNITISDAVVPVYSDQVNISSPLLVTIPVAGYAPGEYVIALEDVSGSGLYGTFVVY